MKEEKNLNQDKEFRRRISNALIYFTVFYVIYGLLMLYYQNFQAFLVIACGGLIIFGYIYLIYPYKYVVKRRTLEICRRFGKNKEINIMNCETICDPLPKMTKVITDPRALEIYLEGSKRIVVQPKDVIGFCEAIIRANKRIHCQVQAYNKTHRKTEKKRKREINRNE